MTKSTPFDDLASMCEFAIERGDIDLLQLLIEDDEDAKSEWQKWKTNV